MVDFTVRDCPRLDFATPQCRGPAPLTLTFVPLTSGNVSTFAWDFGDLTKSDESLPIHTYVLPGIYDVGITAMPGPVSKLRKAYVVVTPNPLGEACDVDRQCDMEPVSPASAAPRTSARPRFPAVTAPGPAAPTIARRTRSVPTWD